MNISTLSFRHVAELLGKFSTSAASGRTSASPGEELFTRFRSDFPTINTNLDYNNVNEILRRFDWGRWEGTDVARAALKAKETLLELVRAGCFQRGDYKWAAELILIYLGVRIKPGSNFVFPDLAKASNARFIQRCLYFVLMLLLMDVPAVSNMFSAREQDTIADMALFSAIYYGPYFLQTTIASRWFVHQIDTFGRFFLSSVLPDMTSP